MFTALLCTDGSPLSRESLAEGLSVLRTPDRIVLAMAVVPVDSAERFSTGLGRHAGASPEATGDDRDTAVVQARAQLAEMAEALGLVDAEQRVVLGSAGPAMCALAESLPAGAVVLGTRGHGGLRRAILGSVSDHILRHAPCPVVIVHPTSA